MEVVSSVVVSIAEPSLALRYIYYYNRNVAVLKDRVRELEDLRDGVRIRSDHAAKNGESILPAVTSWLERVDQLIAEAKSLDGEVQVNRSCCPNLKLRINISRIAAKKTAIAAELKFHGNFRRVYLRVRPATSTQGDEVFESRSDEVFESRWSTCNVIMKAIQDDEINMIGVCGMGGVGKTALVKQVAKQVQDESLCDDVVMVPVSQTPNLTRIQRDIADMVGLKLVDESVEERAALLQARLQRRRSVVILDDIWRPIDLKYIGIPFGIFGQKESCKVVFTCRSRDVCNQMGAQKVILVQVLSEQEAWDLFRKIVGDSVDSPDVQPLALKVIEKCGGLPIAILAVANALRGRTRLYWEDTLNQLARGFVNDLVLSTIQLSFDLLPSEEVRSFFLLCSLLCEDSNIIAIEDVWKYGMGLGLFQGGEDTMEQGRDRAYAFADILISSSLLQKGIGQDSVKMHQVIRDIAISIASKDEHGFLVTSGPRRQFPRVDYTKYTTISLTSHEIIELPTHALDCPNLQFLYLQFKHPCLQFIPDNFFSRMKKLKVLVMSGMRLLSLPQSLMDLDLHLQTLCLEWCTLKDLSIIGSLQTLKILSLVGSNIEELPREMGELTRLEMLDLSQCQQLRIIPYHVILRLSQLQVLYMPRHPARSNVGILDNGRRDQEIVYVGLMDLIQLSRLTSLKIHFDDANSLPEEFIFQNLSRFQISIGLTDYEQPEHFLYSKALTLKSLSTSHLKLLTPCFKTAEYLYLEEIKVLRNVLFDAESAMFEAKSMAPGRGRRVMLTGSSSGRAEDRPIDPVVTEPRADEIHDTEPPRDEQPEPVQRSPPRPRAPPPPAGVIDYAAMAAAAAAAFHARQHFAGGGMTPEERAADRWLKLTTRIVALCPQQFMGTTGAVAAQTWLRDIEKAMDILDCTDSERIRLAAFRLGGDASSWWDACIQEYGRPHLYESSWDEFRGWFEEQFIPGFERMKLREKYESLTQGSKTVEQYYREFVHLSYYAPEETEQGRVHRFLRGFVPTIQERIGHMEFTSVLRVVRCASAAEAVSIRVRSSGEGKRKYDAFSRPGSSTPSSSSFRRPPAVPARAPGSGYQGYRQGPTTWFDGVCRNCGIRGHRMSQCRRSGGGAHTAFFPRQATGGAQGRGAPAQRGYQRPFRPAFRPAGQVTTAPQQQARPVQQRAPGVVPPVAPAAGRVFALRGEPCAPEPTEQYQVDEFEPAYAEGQSYVDDQFGYFQQFLDYQQDQDDQLAEYEQLMQGEQPFLQDQFDEPTGVAEQGDHPVADL